MSKIRCGREEFSQLDRALHLEWLETNGIGGFASSTVVGANTRRYHGLLIAATQPPVGRMLLLSKLDEEVFLEGERYDLAINQYPGVFHPRGDLYLQEFRIDPFPTYLYRIGDLLLEKSLFLVDGENTVCVRYKALEGECRLIVNPLIAFRDFHATTHENNEIRKEVFFEQGRVVLTPYPGLPSLVLAHNAEQAERRSEWFYRFEFEREKERGLDFQEDLYHPVSLQFSLSSSRDAVIVGSTIERSALCYEDLRKQEVKRREAVAASSPQRSGFAEDLTRAADQFLVRRQGLWTVIAGYPWFSDWGRDTMIALPGLTLTRKRFDLARQILETFAASLNQGMLPNRFPDVGEAPEYNTVDATLWFFEALRAYVEVSGDIAFVRESLYSRLKEVIAHHVKGTRYGIHVDHDGLLCCGEEGVQLTWMDAKVGNYVVTPRGGKPVEIQALWYNALRVLQSFASAFEDSSYVLTLRTLAAKARCSFLGKFWNEQESCLYDVVDAWGRDAAIRPNQIFAVSLPYSMLPQDKSRKVVEVVERELLTPLGLRTLSPRDSRYRGVYEGDSYSRDIAYHQGTVWPWLLGPFLRAYRKVFSEAECRQKASQTLEVFRASSHLYCLGQVPEIADGNAPYAPKGCFAQAWSVAELLRIIAENGFEERG